jgi:2-C-methyl-D-erythritol 4-phosphate cytidylyltransferase
VKASAVIPAAGSGRRMGGAVPKQFLMLDDRPVVVHTLQIFESSPLIDEVILVVPPGEEGRCRREWVERFGLKKVRHCLGGGRERQDSVMAGVRAVSGESGIVLVHDGVRPFVTHSMIRDVIEAARISGGAIVAVPARDTLKQVDADGFIERTLERSSSWLAQTPQAFQTGLLVEAQEKAARDGAVLTDESALVERMGVRVRIVPGSWKNFKITQPEDLALAEGILRTQAVPTQKETG